MAKLMLFLSQLSLILCLLDHNRHVTFAHQHSSSQASNPTTTTANASTALSLTHAHSSSHANPSTGGPHATDEHNMKIRGSILSNKMFSGLSQQRQIYPRSILDTSTELPAPFNSEPDSSQYLPNYQDILSGLCTIDDDFCFFETSNGSIVKADATRFSDDCVLWNDTCSGDRTAALKNFFDTAFCSSPHNRKYGNGPLLANGCFQQRFVNQSDCNTFNSPERLSEFRTIKDWMRSSQCISAADEWIAMTGYSWGYFFAGWNITKANYIDFFGNLSYTLPSCCGSCLVYAENVDLYYWPEPESDQSCLSIVGDSVRPVDYGATTEGSTTYWACNWTQSSKTGILTTAQITTIGSLAVKVSRYDPWSSSPCDVDEPGSQKQSIKARDEYASVYRRAHSLIIPTPITQTDGLLISTIVSGNFTL